MPINPPRGIDDLGETATVLLAELIEAERGRPRHPWIVTRTNQGTQIIRSGIDVRFNAYWGDVLELAEVGAIRFEQRDRNSGSFDILRAGYQHAEETRARTGVGTVAAEVTRFLDDAGFRRRHPAAHAKWSSANRALWSEDAAERLTAIGHDCREALQAFASELVAAHQPPDAPTEVNKDYARVKAVIDLRRAALGDRVHAVLDALLQYWGTVTDLVQRQEHAPDLTWEDARRVVFLAAVAMYEVDRAQGN